MKAILLTLAAALTLSSVALPAFACTITPQGDTRLRMEALLNAFDQMESLLEIKNTSGDVYKVVTYNHATLTKERRLYELLNTSAMCPIYEAREIK